MNKTLLTISAFTVFGLLFFKDFKAIGDPNGSKYGYTGGPRDGKTCGSNGGCHTGSPVTFVDTLITSNIPAEGYTPGETYTISATVIEANRVRFGFNITTEDAAGVAKGTFISNSVSQAKGSGKYATNLSSSNSGSGSRTWDVTWTAPATGSGDITFYAAFNAANNQNNDSGDLIFTSSYTVSEVVVNNGVDKVAAEVSNAKLFPNPVYTDATLELILAAGNYTLNIIDLTGKTIDTGFQKFYSHGGTQQINVSFNELPVGLYFLEIQGETSKKVLRFQKN